MTLTREVRFRVLFSRGQLIHFSPLGVVGLVDSTLLVDVKHHFKQLAKLLSAESEFHAAPDTAVQPEYGGSCASYRLNTLVAH